MTQWRLLCASGGDYCVLQVPSRTCKYQEGYLCFNGASAGHPLKCEGNWLSKFAAHEIDPMELRGGQVGSENIHKKWRHEWSLTYDFFQESFLDPWYPPLPNVKVASATTSLMTSYSSRSLPSARNASVQNLPEHTIAQFAIGKIWNLKKVKISGTQWKGTTESGVTTW